MAMVLGSVKSMGAMRGAGWGDAGSKASKAASSCKLADQAASGAQGWAWAGHSGSAPTGMASGEAAQDASITAKAKCVLFTTSLPLMKTDRRAIGHTARRVNRRRGLGDRQGLWPIKRGQRQALPKGEHQWPRLAA